jgi:hypothetical protein
MVNSEQAGGKETLQEQYDIVRNQTDKSHVMQYGGITWTALPIADFIGNEFLESLQLAGEAHAALLARGISDLSALQAALAQRELKAAVPAVESRLKIKAALLSLKHRQQHELHGSPALLPSASVIAMPPLALHAEAPSADASASGVKPEADAQATGSASATHVTIAVPTAVEAATSAADAESPSSAAPSSAESS